MPGGEPTSDTIPANRPDTMVIDDLFEATQIIDNLGLNDLPQEPPARRRRGPKNKWRDAFASLDGINLRNVPSEKPSLLKSVPGFIKGQLREAYVMEKPRRK